MRSTHVEGMRRKLDRAEREGELRCRPDSLHQPYRQPKASELSHIGLKWLGLHSPASTLGISCLQKGVTLGEGAFGRQGGPKELRDGGSLGIALLAGRQVLP